MTDEDKTKVIFICGTIALTVGIHYGWIFQPIFGQSHWIHALHGRFCYIPIVMAASWFGLRGGLAAAAAISVLVLPYIIGGDQTDHNLAGELVEVVFYFAIAVLTGALIDREWSIRRRQEETQLQLERSHKLSLVGQMAAGVAHEIKNPLASIKGAVEILGDKTASAAEKAEFQNIILKEVRRIDGTVSEFLEFARPREAKLEKLNLSQTVHASLKQMEAHAAKVGIRLAPDLMEDVIILGDPEKMHQVILNLLINAIHASGRDSVIDVHLSGFPYDHAVLTIRDHGIGIEPSNLQKVFDPFYTTKPSGTGLGLSIVKTIVENHGGEIKIDSAPGQGTTATVTFPLRKE